MSENTAAAARAISIKNAIKSADFRPKLLTAMKEEVRELLLGRLVGETNGIFYQADPKDATVIQEGLKGVFRFTPADGVEGDTLQSSKLWIPDSASDLYRPILREHEEQVDETTGVVTPARKVSMVVALDVYAIRSTAALGYTWKFTPVIQPVANDPTDPFTKIAAMLGDKAATAAIAATEPAKQVEDKSDAKANAKK